jgi:UDP-N-acetylmuramate dehydrogenase
MNIQYNFSLKDFNTFHIDHKAASFAALYEYGDIRKLITEGVLKEQPYFILGGGSNVLFTKDFDGIVLHPQFKGIEIIFEDKSNISVRIGAGEVWEDFVEYTVSQSWYGIENLALIPGSVGAASIQNIGAYGVELKDVFYELRAVNLENGDQEVFSKEDCEFAYRSSIFKTGERKYLIYDIVLNLSKEKKLNLTYHAIKDHLKDIPENEITQRMVFDSVVNIRNSKLPNPDLLGNAGSFFKNPVVSQEKFKSIESQYPEVKGYLQDNGSVKLAAGWLIEKTNLKGFRDGDAGVHEKQALVLVNYGNASGKNICDLSDIIEQKVFLKFGVKLEKEVNVL